MIIAIKDNDEVYIAIDARQSSLIGLSEKDLINCSNLAMWKDLFHDKTIIASDFEVRHNDIIHYSDIFDKQINMKTLQMYTVKKINELLSEFGFQENRHLWTGSIFIGHYDKLYIIDAYGLVSEVQHYSCISSHHLVALESLRISCKSNIIDRMLEAFHRSFIYGRSERYPIYYFSTNNTNIRDIKPKTID